VKRGLLVPVHIGVYRMPGLPRSYEREVLAACLATGGVASNRSAAAIYRLRGFERYRKTIEITVDGRRAPTLPGVLTHMSTRLVRSEVGVIPVTTPAQTLVDLAHVEPRLAEGALNHALGKGLIRLPALVRYLSDLGPRPGSARLRELVELQTKGVRPTASWLEDRVLEFLRSLGLPEPVRQHPLRLKDGRRIWFDFAYPARRISIEADSRLWHSTPKAQRADAERDRAAAALGWTVVRITWLDLEERPREIARWFSAQAA
jgi:very-short-patch-repair endonuclease